MEGLQSLAQVEKRISMDMRSEARTSLSKKGVHCSHSAEILGNTTSVGAIG